MDNARAFRELLGSGQTQDALDCCRRMIASHPEFSYYRFWEERLQGKRESTRQTDAHLVQKNKWNLANDFNANEVISSYLKKKFLEAKYKVLQTFAGCNDQADPLTQIEKITKQLPFNSPIYLPTSKIPLSDQVRGLIQVLELCGEFNRKVTWNRFEVMREAIRLTGRKRVFVIGNGPSLKKTDLHLLRDEVTIGFNGIFLHDYFVPTIYVVEDHLVAEDRFNEIHKYQCPIKIFPSYLGYCIEPQENTIFLNHLPRKSYPVDTDFSDKAGEITYTGGTVTYTGMQLAASLGFEEIYLVGVDASYKVENVVRSEDYGTGVLSSKTDDINHFDPRYFGKGYRWHDPNVHTMLQAYRKVRDYAQRKKIHVTNATIGGELEVFPRVDFYTIFELDVVYPKVAILDFTHIRQLCATGIIKRNLFEQWPASSLLNVFSARTDRLSAYQKVPNDCYAVDSDVNCIWAAVRSILEFNPDVLYLRPTPDRLLMTVVQMVMVVVTEKPLVVHYMDDWVAKVGMLQGKGIHKIYQRLMSMLFNRAQSVLVISSKMADYLANSYDIPRKKIKIVHNFLQTPPTIQFSRRFMSKIGVPNVEPQVIRYFGGLEPDMSLGSVERVADAVEKFNSKFRDRKLVFEVYTGDIYHERYTQVFSSYPSTVLCRQITAYGDYLSALQDSDINLLCYNFDNISEEYLRYSLANKLPEIVSVDVPFIAIGSPEIGTIGYLKDQTYPYLVTKASSVEVLNHLEDILISESTHAKPYLDSIEAIRQEFSEENNRLRLYSVLRNATSSTSEKFNTLEVKEIARLLNELIIQNKMKYVDLNTLIGLILEERSILNGLREMIRIHGIEWSVKDLQGDLKALFEKSGNPELWTTEQQVWLLAFLISSLGNVRFSLINDKIRDWLHKRQDAPKNFLKQEIPNSI